MTEHDKDFRILMVGASGAGKTSLLTAMYDTLEKVFGDNKCTFTPDPSTSGKLDEYRDTLVAYAGYDDPNRPIMVNPLDEGLQGSKDRRTYRFGVRFPEPEQQANHDLMIQFDDIPGGWFSSKDGGDSLNEALQRADALIVAIDSTALMYDIQDGEFGRHHQKFNRPKSIVCAIKHAGVGLTRADGDGDRIGSVIYTLTKAETYCQTAQEADVLKRKAIAAYAELTKYLTAQKIPVYLTIVETVGCLRLHRYTIEDGDVVRPEFRRIVDRKYSPKNCDVPFRLIFKEALENKLDSDRKGYYDFMNSWIEWMGLRSRILSVINDFPKLDSKSYQALK